MQWFYTFCINSFHEVKFWGFFVCLADRQICHVSMKLEDNQHSYEKDQIYKKETFFRKCCQVVTLTLYLKLLLYD